MGVVFLGCVLCALAFLQHPYVFCRMHGDFWGSWGWGVRLGEISVLCTDGRPGGEGSEERASHRRGSMGTGHGRAG